MNHVTYHVTTAGLQQIGTFMRMLGYREAPPDDPFEHGYDVRWFSRPGSPLVHFVADGEPGDVLALGHFCVVVAPAVYSLLIASRFLVRNSGSGRIWVQCDNVRVEVRPTTKEPL